LWKERQIVVDEKLRNHSITNNLNLLSIEQQKSENLQSEYWREQLNERRLVEQQEEEKDIIYEEEFRQHLDKYDRQEFKRQKLKNLFLKSLFIRRSSPSFHF
jgi:hypothetical protein